MESKWDWRPDQVRVVVASPAAAGLRIDGDDLTGETFRFACGPRECRDAPFHFAPRVDERFGRLAGDHPGKLFAAGTDSFGDAP